MVKTFIDVLEELQVESGTNAKIELIKVNKDNIQLRKYLEFVLDKNLTFGIVEFEYSIGDGRFDDIRAWDNFLSLAEQLLTRKLTGNAALEEIKRTFAWYNEKQCIWFRRCLQKDLSIIGIGQTIFEKAYEETGFKFRLMLAEEEAEIDKVEDQPGYLDKKANGVRTIPVIEDGKLAIIYGGRDGKSADNFYFIKDELELLVSKFGDSWKSCIFDGEMHVNDSLKNTMSLYGFKFREESEFYGKNGKIKQKALDNYLEDYNRIMAFQNDAKYVIFDAMPKASWDAQSYDKTLHNRKAELRSIKSFIEELKLTRIQVIETEYVENKAEAITAAQRWIERGFEGGIWKISSGLYQWKRTRNLIKIKEVQDFEIMITGFEKQKPKYNGDGSLKPDMVGKVIGIDRNGNEHKVGTGEALPEKVREHMYNDPGYYLGKIATCSAQCPSGDKFICPRLDIIRLDRNSLD